MLTASQPRVRETLPQEVLTKMHAPPQNPDIPFATPDALEAYDGFLFGIPTRYGNFPAQWKAFWDSTGKQWQSGGYWGKYAGVFVSTATPGGGQESTVINALSTLAHHGIIYVPLGYKTTFPLLADLSEVRGGSPWGAGTFAVSWKHLRLFEVILIKLANHMYIYISFQAGDGSRQPTNKEIDLAIAQGKAFYETVAKTV